MDLGLDKREVLVSVGDRPGLELALAGATNHLSSRPELCSHRAPGASVDVLYDQVVATVLAPGAHRRGKVSQRTDLMEAARRAGQETVKSPAIM